MRPDIHPLDRAAAGVAAREQNQAVDLGRPTTGDWQRVADLGDGDGFDGLLDWIAGADPARRRPPDVAASDLASGIGSCVVAPAATLLVLGGVLPDVRATNIWLRRSAAGAWFDRVAFEHRTFTCLGGTADATHADARPVPTLDEAIARLADEAVATLAPVFDAIRARAPYGRSGMWGSVADDLATALLWITRRMDGDPTEQRRSWAVAESTSTAIAVREPLLRARPTRFDIEWSAGTALFCRLGTCCLAYKAPEVASRGERYCTSCPLIDDADRTARWSAFLERTASPR